MPVLFALLGAGCGAAEREGAPAGSGASTSAALATASPSAGSVATASPDGPSGAKRVPTRSFRTLAGGEAGLADLSGNVVIANLWGTWCLPCRRELPELVELAEAYADQPVVILGIAVESGDEEEIRDFLADYGVEYPIWMIGMDIAMGTFGAVGFPYTLIVDPDGWIRKELVGPQTVESLTAEIEALLP